MKYRLASKTTKPPHGWMFTQYPTVWSVKNPLSVSWQGAIDQIFSFRQANPGYALSLSQDAIAADLEEFTVARLQTDPRALHLLIPADEEAKKNAPTVQVPRSLRSVVVDAVARIKQDARGARVIADWLGHGGHPVPLDQATWRASVCGKCPKNVHLSRAPEHAIAQAILEQQRVRTKLALRVPNESTLKSCDVCGCVLALKVWVPLEHIDKEEGFPPNCWIPQEDGKPGDGRTITVQRKGAIGDVIAATSVADKLKALGHRIRFACVKSIHPILAGHPSITEVCEPDRGQIDICLDGGYERHSDARTRHFTDLFLETAARVVRPISRRNYVPTLKVTEAEEALAAEVMAPYPKPWVVVIPRSNSWPNRTVTQESWNAMAHLVHGTCFWTGTDPCAVPLVALTPCELRTLMAYITAADLVVSVDTGPLHIAAAFNRPIVVIQQAFRAELRLSDQTDYAVFECGQPCSPCMDYTCKLPGMNPKFPACATVNAVKLADAVNIRTDRYSVSAVIPVYGSNRERLERCILAIRGQVDEIVVTMDGNSLTYHDHRVISVPSTGKRLGYGKTCNRGARHSTGKWLLMLNDDCYLKPDAVAKMLEVADDETAVVGCLLRYPDGTIQHAGTKRQCGDIGFGHIDWKKTEPSIKAPCAMEFVTFAAALVRREAFYQVRGFDEDYDSYSEDADFCIRIRLAGWKVMFTPFAEGIHEESQSSGKEKAGLLQGGNDLLKRKWGKYFAAA